MYLLGKKFSFIFYKREKEEIQSNGFETFWEQLFKNLIFNYNDKEQINKDGLNDNVFNIKSRTDYLEKAIDFSNLLKRLYGHTSMMINNQETNEFFIERTNEFNNEEIYNNIEVLLEKCLLNKKIEFMAYKFSSLEFLIKSPKISAVQEALSLVKERNKFSDKKLNLISRYFDSLNSSFSIYEKSLGDYQHLLEELTKISFFPEANDEKYYKPEKFIYKTIIELSLHQKELIESLIDGINHELSCYSVLNHEIENSNDFKELYGIHVYLNSIALRNFLNIKEKIPAIDKLIGYLDELDGIIIKLELKVKEVKHIKVLMSNIKKTVSFLLLLF